MNREEKIEILSKTYGWDIEELSRHNESQIDTLYSACTNEDGTLRTKDQS